MLLFDPGLSQLTSTSHQKPPATCCVVALSLLLSSGLQALHGGLGGRGHLCEMIYDLEIHSTFHNFSNLNQVRDLSISLHGLLTLLFMQGLYQLWLSSRDIVPVAIIVNYIHKMTFLGIPKTNNICQN